MSVSRIKHSAIHTITVQCVVVLGNSEYTLHQFQFQEVAIVKSKFCMCDNLLASVKFSLGAEFLGI